MKSIFIYLFLFLSIVFCVVLRFYVVDFCFKIFHHVDVIFEYFKIKK